MEHAAMETTDETRSTLVSAAPRVLVRDKEEALAFYARLGFATTYHDEGFAIVERDRVALHFNAADGPMSGGGVCWIRVTNIEALYKDYLPTSAIASSALTVQRWGFKDLFIRDPSRNLILFGEPTSDDEATAEQTAVGQDAR
jgi:catechol 2,3-dioxygenase-like lactoylglutathione lyase family enzyme